MSIPIIHSFQINRDFEVTVEISEIAEELFIEEIMQITEDLGAMEQDSEVT